MSDSVFVTLIIIAAVGNGILAGLVIGDWARRAGEVKSLLEKKKEIDDNMTEIAKVHNGLAQTVQKMQDKLGAHELRLTSAQPGVRK